VVDLPETRYVKTDDGFYLAYQVLGDGPVDLVYLHGWATHVEAQWGIPSWARFLERLSAFSRLIMFDKRGTGLSDPMPLDYRPTLEGWMQDLGSVLGAVGSEQAALFGCSDGGPAAMLFAATFPQRSSGLVLVNSFAGLRKTPERPWGWSPEIVEDYVGRAPELWAESDSLDIFGPSVARDASFRQLWSSYNRLCATPGMARMMLSLIMDTDVEPIVATLRVPTLVVHREGDRFADVKNGRQLAKSIPGARYVEVPGDDHLYFVGDTDRILDEVEEFLTGARASATSERVLATVLFTDIVASTEHAFALGDRGWHERLDAHNAMVRRQLDRFRGREIDTTGDGFLATFDGPARAIQCACAIRDGARQLGIEVRAGLHTGEIGLRGDDIGGVAINIGARVMARAGAGEVLVSRTVTDLVSGSGIEFEDRGEHELKGVPGLWKLYAVVA
jgi:pimeloyl-ACP methyl ester carboxylesterase